MAPATRRCLAGLRGTGQGSCRLRTGGAFQIADGARTAKFGQGPQGRRAESSEWAGAGRGSPDGPLRCGILVSVRRAGLRTGRNGGSHRTNTRGDRTRPRPAGSVHNPELPEAEKEYQEAIRLRPDFAQARLDLASVFAAQGEMPQAVDQLRQVANGSDPAAARIAAGALQRLGEH